jgi:hypothetical protein
MTLRDRFDLVGRKKRYHEVMSAPFPGGTFVRMLAVRTKGETKTDLVRKAVERELDRRERLLKKRKMKG